MRPDRGSDPGELRLPYLLPGSRHPRLSHAQPGHALWQVSGQRCALAVVDDFTHKCLTLIADTSLSGSRVARELDAIIARHGRPITVVSDNGTEFTSNAILSRRQRTAVDWHYIAPENPCKTASSRASTDGSVMSFLTRCCSRPRAMPAARSPHGRRITANTDPIPPSETSHRRNLP